MEVKETEQQNELKELVRDIFKTALKLYEFIDKKADKQSAKTLIKVANNLEQCNKEMSKLVDVQSIIENMPPF